MAYFSADFLLPLGHLTLDFLAFSSLFPWHCISPLSLYSVFFTGPWPKCRPFARFYSQTNSFLTWASPTPKVASIVAKVCPFPMCGQTSRPRIPSLMLRNLKVKTPLFSPTQCTSSLSLCCCLSANCHPFSFPYSKQSQMHQGGRHKVLGELRAEVPNTRGLAWGEEGAREKGREWPKDERSRTE